MEIFSEHRTTFLNNTQWDSCNKKQNLRFALSVIVNPPVDEQFILRDHSIQILCTTETRNNPGSEILLVLRLVDMVAQHILHNPVFLNHDYNIWVLKSLSRIISTSEVQFKAIIPVHLDSSRRSFNRCILPKFGAQLKLEPFPLSKMAPVGTAAHAISPQSRTKCES